MHEQFVHGSAPCVRHDPMGSMMSMFMEAAGEGQSDAAEGTGQSVPKIKDMLDAAIQTLQEVLVLMITQAHYCFGMDMMCLDRHWSRYFRSLLR